MDRAEDPDTGRLLTFMLETSRALVAQRSVPDLLTVAATKFLALTGAERMEVYTLDHTNRFLLRSFDSAPSEHVPDPVPLYRDNRRNSASILAYAAFAGRVVTLGDIYKFSGFDFGPTYLMDRRTGHRTTSLLAFPLRNHDSMTIGVMQATNLAGAGTSNEDVLRPWIERGITAFADMVAVALTNLRLVEEKQVLIRRLARQNDSLVAENARLRIQRATTHGFAGMIGASPAMQDVFALAGRTLASEISVLLLGETGTGKDVLAQAIHRLGPRQAAPFIAQNCAALPEHLLESELFGHRRGAFTGALDNKPGLFQAADGGTLFLDEIGDMPLALQGKLLHVLQNNEVRPVGETKSRKVDVRIIAATNQKLREKVRNGTFREDLFYRLCVFPITLPPLRERRADIMLLAEHFLAMLALEQKRAKPTLSRRVCEQLERHDFPGNIRELRNGIERAVLLLDGEDTIDLHHLPLEWLAADESRANFAGPLPPDGQGLREIIGRYEAVVIASSLEDNGWNQTATARSLAISRRSLVEKMQRHAIKRVGRPD